MKRRRSPVLSFIFLFHLFGGWFYTVTVANHNSCRRLKFLEHRDGYALDGHVFKNIALPVGMHTHSHCRNWCTMEDKCKSINIGPLGKKGQMLCQLSDSDHLQHPNDLKPMAGFIYRGTENKCCFNMCYNNATCLVGFTGKGYKCVCPPGYTGNHCEKAFKAVFTNLNASGRFGPTTLGSHYAGQDHDGQVTLSSGIQNWTVPYTGDYRIEAIGAAGGYDTGPNSTQYRGRGARMIGTFSLNKSEVIQILVGQEGGINTLDLSSGGGGGTSVVRGANEPLIIAGGGGGVQRAKSRHSECDANAGSSGNPGLSRNFEYTSWSGGSNGHGAQTTDGGYTGGGGGGFYSSGRSSRQFGGTNGTGGEGGKGFLQKGVGGRALFNDVVGGFGGGGGAYGRGGGGGGGGGYSGGSSGDAQWDACGGGGGSYNAGKSQQKECCYRSSGHGKVIITFLQRNISDGA